MTSVTQTIKGIKQPRGGYINPKQFHKITLPISEELHEIENLHSSIIGLAVDYLSRFMSGTKVDKAFEISLLGARNIGELKKAEKLINTIKKLDNESIIAACQLVGYDVVYRSGISGYRPVENILPDKNTIENIRIMVERSQQFFSTYGPVIKDGFTFEGGYSKKVTKGDGDFLTDDTIWDFKVINGEFKNQHTLQLLMYYIMGKRSIHSEFKKIHNLGFYNPRLNVVATLPISEISNDIINVIEKEVFQYES